MKLKVCGNLKNVEEVADMSPDLMGFIFYDQSPRNFGTAKDMIRNLPATIERVGVFVNEDIDVVRDTVKEYSLDGVQLHGDESTDYLSELQSEEHQILKVFRVIDELPTELSEFKRLADYFLFDTRTNKYGGSGKQFDWTILDEVDHPFFLSGGLKLDDVSNIQSIKNPYLKGIDVNSGFEISPGYKDVDLLKKLKSAL